MVENGLVEAAGGWMVRMDKDYTPPCHLNQQFFAYEKETETPLDLMRGNGAVQRAPWLYNRAIEAKRRWCGACPIAAACLERGVRDQHTGFAGGEWLIDGESQTEMKENAA